MKVRLLFFLVLPIREITLHHFNFSVAKFTQLDKLILIFISIAALFVKVIAIIRENRFTSSLSFKSKSRYSLTSRYVFPLPAEASTLCTQASLPVTLANFDAAQKSGKVTLTWNTMLELNNDGFEIERRIGAGAYQKIAFVDSKAPGGNGAEFSYSFEDNTVLPKGVSYYRLRQVDFDGRATYSEIKAVRTGNGAIILSVYPNPSRGTVNVAIPDGIGTFDVSVDDFTGKSVQRFSGLTSRNMQLNNLKPGMYMLRVSIRATGETITERIAVQ